MPGECLSSPRRSVAQPPRQSMHPLVRECDRTSGAKKSLIGSVPDARIESGDLRLFLARNALRPLAEQRAAENADAARTNGRRAQVYRLRFTNRARPLAWGLHRNRCQLRAGGYAGTALAPSARPLAREEAHRLQRPPLYPASPENLLEAGAGAGRWCVSINPDVARAGFVCAATN